ncbi:AraC family transcriptional regulator [Tomitella gaofuii]|uniref:AraC family transcriptional regulator n=1 Tax=Tomitella gaofuii TaxID=2760083 RepID=UPI001C70D9EA|nr:AraC family transcriptional regulator [Tomitella gaofuii]
MTASAPVGATRVVWLWAGHAAYLGPSFQLGAHSTPVHCFALGVDGPFSVTTAADGARTCRSALIPARTTHRIDSGDGRMLFFYTDPRSVHADRLRSAMRDRAGTITSTHRAEGRLLAALRGDVDPGHLCRTLLGGDQRDTVDHRVRQAMDRILDDLAADLSAARLAADAGLSTSRFLHVFSAGAGTSLRRYRLWSRLLAVAAIEEGGRMTDAAADAGFASPSHFSDTFRAMFGLTATDLLARGTTIIPVDRRSAQRRPRT